jgi:hypothetical protein
MLTVSPMQWLFGSIAVGYELEVKNSLNSGGKGTDESWQWLASGLDSFGDEVEGG